LGTRHWAEPPLSLVPQDHGYGNRHVQSWRLQLREAEEAFRAGRLDEAATLVRQGDLHRYLPGKKLSVAIAEQLAGEPGTRLRQGESAEGWQDLDVACRLSSRAEGVLAIRREIVEGCWRMPSVVWRLARRPKRSGTGSDRATYGDERYRSDVAGGGAAHRVGSEPAPPRKTCRCLGPVGAGRSVASWSWN
jgi:hypothetical protein